MQKLCMFVGIFSVGCGVFTIWMAYGFASTMDPDVQGVTRPHEIRRTLNTDGATGYGFVMICAGLWLAISKPEPNA